MDPEKFSSQPLSPDEIRLENEILKLRLQAEFGSVFPDPASGEADPEPEYAFLKRVLQLHQRLARTAPKPLREVLDFDQFAPADSFSNETSLRDALWAAIDYLEDANVLVDFDNDYPDRVMYDFITQELADLEVIGRPGNDEYICVLYEAFHPNLPAEASAFAEEFLECLLLGDLTTELHAYFSKRSLPARSSTVAELLELIRNFENCFEQICSLNIETGSTDVDASGTGACVGGALSYSIQLSDRSILEIDTPFRVELRRDGGLWFVTDFEFRGFVWPGAGYPSR